MFFPPVELLPFPFIQLCDDVGESAINPGNNHCEIQIKMSSCIRFEKENISLKRCGFTMFDGVHTAVGNFYSFIQGDKGGLQTESKEITECPEHCMPVFLNHWSSFMHKSGLLLFTCFLIIDVNGHSKWTTVKLFYRPLPAGKPIPPGVPPLLHSSSSAWRSALLLSPIQSTRNLEDTVRSHSNHTVTKPNLTDLNVIYCRRLLGSAQKLEE